MDGTPVMPIRVGDAVEEAHRPDYPWPEPRARGVVVAVADDHVMVRWTKWDKPHRVDRDRIGSKPTDLIRCST